MGLDHWTLEAVTMDAGFPSVWGFHESMEDLKHKLLCATSELEALRANAKEEIRKRAENIDQLIRLLQVIAHERDVARDQLQLLLSNISRPNTGEEYSPTQTRGSCSVTESDSLSATPNHHSYGGGASPGSPELPSINMGVVPQQQQQQQKYDRASAIIDGLAMKSPLPRKGKLLQAVLEAGPLLQTLLLAGPLPQWRNPPPLQPFQVPPVGLHNASLLDEKIVPDPTNPAVLNIPGGTGLCTTKRTMASPCMKSYDTWNVKRQKTQCT